jgi:MFS family permease
MADTPQTAAQEWRAYWPMVLSGMVGMSFYSMFAYSQQMFIEPLEKEFGWPRAQISMGYTIFALMAFFCGPLIGMAIDRWGARRIAVPGLLLSSLAFAALGLTGRSLVQWYGLWLVLALVGLGVKSTVWSAAASSSFNKSRGMALALILCGSAIAQSLAPLVGNWLIPAYGWRMAYFLIGGCWGGIALVLTAFFFFDAASREKKAANPTAKPPVLAGLTFKQAMRSTLIWRIFIANVISSLVGSGASFHLKPIIVSTGLSSSTAAQVAALAGISGIAGKLLTGWLLDRFQGNLVPVLSFALSAVGYFFLMNTFDAVTAVALGVLIIGYTSGAGLAITAYLISRYAGLRAFGAVYGALGSMLMLGSAIGPPMAGYIFDSTHSYRVLLLIAIPGALIGAALFMGLGKYPEFTVDDEDVDAVPPPSAGLPPQ